MGCVSYYSAEKPGTRGLIPGAGGRRQILGLRTWRAGHE